MAVSEGPTPKILKAVTMGTEGVAPSFFNRFRRGGKEPKTNPGVETAYSIEKNKLTIPGGTNKEGGKVEAMAHIPQIVHEQMTQVIGNQMQALINIRKRDPVMFNALIVSPEHQAEGALLNMVMDTEGELDYNKIGNILRDEGKKSESKTGVGWQVAMLTLDKALTRQMYSLGLAGVLTEQKDGRRRDTTASRSYRADSSLSSFLNIDRSNLNKWLGKHGKAAAWMGGATAAGAGIGAAAAKIFGLGSVVGGGVVGGLMGGGVVGAVGGAAALVREGLKGGYKIDQEAFATGLTMMQQDPIEREFMVQAFGINPNDFMVVGNEVQLSANVDTYQTSDIPRKQKELVDMMMLRLTVYESWGIGIDSLDAFPEQANYIYDRVPGAGMGIKGERNSSVHEHTLERRFQEIKAIQGGNPTKVELLQMRHQARREVHAQLTQELIEERTKPSKEKKRKDNIASLEKQKNRFGTGKGETAETKGKKVVEMTKKATDEKSELTNLKVKVEATQTQIEEYLQAREDLDETWKDLGSDYRLVRGTATLDDIDAEIKRRENLTPDKLQQMHDELKQVEDKLEEANVQRDVIFGHFQDGERSFTTITSYGIGVDVLSREDLNGAMQAINDAHKADSTKGWPKSENENVSKRTMVFAAMAEARSQQYLPPTRTELDLVINSSTNGLNHGDVLTTLSPEELISYVGQVDDGSGLRPLTQDEARSAQAQAIRIFNVRSQVWAHIAKEEGLWVEQFNASRTLGKPTTARFSTLVEDSKEYAKSLKNYNTTKARHIRAIDGNIVTLKAQDLLGRKKDNEAHPLAKLKELRAKVEAADKHLELNSDQTKALQESLMNGVKTHETITTTIHAALPPPPTLLTADLATLQIHEVMERINAAHSHLNTVGWKKEKNAEHMEEVAQAMLEARMLADRPEIIPVAPTALDNLVAWNMSEKDIVSMSENEIFQEANRIHRRDATQGWPSTENGTAFRKGIAQGAITEAKRRFNIRIDTFVHEDFVEVIDKRTEVLTEEIEHAHENLADDRFFVETVHDMASQETARTLPWVWEWAGPGPQSLAKTDGSHNFVPLDDTEHTKGELSNDNGTPRVLPRSYYELLNALTGYQSKEAHKREEMFKKLVIHDQFKPEAITQKLDTNLGLGLPANSTITEAFMAIQIRLAGIPPGQPGGPLPPSLSPASIQHAMQSIVQDYIHRGVTLT